jgi:pilus assembly protein CpaE
MVAPDPTTAPNTARTVLVIDAGKGDPEAIAAMVCQRDGYGVEMLAADRILESRAVQGTYIAILIELSDIARQDVFRLETLRSVFPGVPLVVISDPLAPEEMQHLIRLGVQDWLPKPVDADAIAEALSRDMRSGQRPAARVHAVLPAVAGAGSTSVAVTLADLFATEIARPGESVALVDLDFTLGPCGYRLNLSSGLPLDNVIIDPRRIDTELTALIRQRHARGFYVYSYANRTLVTHVNCYEFVLRLLEVLASAHDYIIVDFPYHETDWRQDILTGADSITMVTEANLPAVKHAIDLIQLLASIQQAPDITEVLVNKDKHSFFGGRRLSEDTLRKLFGATPFHFIPLDQATLTDALDRGVPPPMVDGSAEFVKALRGHLRNHLLRDHAQPEVSKS